MLHGAGCSNSSSDIFGTRTMFKKEAEVFLRIKVICLCSFYYGINFHACLRSVRVSLNSQFSRPTTSGRILFSLKLLLRLDSFAEMDTVHSSQESKRVILTFFLIREKLFLAFIMNRCTKGAVKLVFDKLERR